MTLSWRAGRIPSCSWHQTLRQKEMMKLFGQRFFFLFVLPPLLPEKKLCWASTHPRQESKVDRGVGRWFYTDWVAREAQASSRLHEGNGERNKKPISERTVMFMLSSLHLLVPYLFSIIYSWTLVQILLCLSRSHSVTRKKEDNLGNRKTPKDLSLSGTIVLDIACDIHFFKLPKLQLVFP